MPSRPMNVGAASAPEPGRAAAQARAHPEAVQDSGARRPERGLAEQERAAERVEIGRDALDALARAAAGRACSSS